MENFNYAGFIKKAPQRYSELQHSVGGVSQKMLTQSLHEMIDDGIVERHAYPEVPPRVEYKLTALGESMNPILQAMHNWGNHYLDEHPEKRQHVS